MQVRLRLIELLELTGRIGGLPPGTTSIYLTLIGITSGTRTTSSRSVEIDPEGRFRLPGLQRGRYQLRMSLPSGAEELDLGEGSYIGSVELRTDTAETDFIARKPTRLTGAIEVEWPQRDDLPGTATRNSLSFRLIAADGFHKNVRIEPPDYTFDVNNLPPGRYELAFSGPGPNVMRRSPEGKWEPISEVVLSEGRTTELALRVRFELGRLMVLVRPPPGSEDAAEERLAAHYVVGIRRDDRVMLLPTDQNGRLVMRYFSRGDYEICAWRELTREEAEDPATWRKAGRAVRRFRHEEGVDMEITLTAAP